jgi:NAD binding domain of 6-phosphogluconate dehydrogenase
MGHAVAERLLGGDHEVTVWNRTPQKADDLVAKGAREGATPAVAAEGTEATFTSLADDAAVLAVVTGQDGVALGDGVLIDASTVSPKTTADLAEAVGGRLLASPILGSPTAVLSGEALNRSRVAATWLGCKGRIRNPASSSRSTSSPSGRSIATSDTPWRTSARHNPRTPVSSWANVAARTCSPVSSAITTSCFSDAQSTPA